MSSLLLTAAPPDFKTEMDRNGGFPSGHAAAHALSRIVKDSSSISNHV
jgi:hypothetical protein